jgi:hypothetical protein
MDDEPYPEGWALKKCGRNYLCEINSNQENANPG